MRSVASFLTTLCAVSISTIGCFAEPPMQYAGEQAMPNFGASRLDKPASKAQVAILTAYQEKTCPPRPGVKWEKEEGRGARFTFGTDPMMEIDALEKLLPQSKGMADEPRILERLVSDWGDVDERLWRECGQFQIKPEMTIGELEKAETTLFRIGELREKARTEPVRLCADLHARFPDYTLRAACPGLNAPALPPDAAAAPSEPGEQAAGDSDDDPGWFEQ